MLSLLLVWAAVLGSLLTGRDANATPPVPPSPTAPHTPVAPAHPAARNAVMGTGEPRNPEPFTLQQRLLDAVSRNDRQTIERALTRGAPLTAKDDIQRSVVLLAVLDARDLSLVQWLHGKGAVLDEPDAGGRTPLSFAAATGQLEIVRYLVSNGAAVDRADAQQRTPLFHAVLGGHREVASYLLDRKANVNTVDQFGDSPLIVACAKGFGAMATLLTERGADAAIKDQEGRTAADRAAPGTSGCTPRATPAR